MIGANIRLAIAGALLAAAFGSGWFVRDAFCDAAEAKAELASSRTAHEATKLDLEAAQLTLIFSNTGTASIEAAAAKREEIVHERASAPPDPVRAACRLDRRGLDWLRSIAAD